MYIIMHVKSNFTRYLQKELPFFSYFYTGWKLLVAKHSYNSLIEKQLCLAYEIARITNQKER